MGSRQALISFLLLATLLKGSFSADLGQSTHTGKGNVGAQLKKWIKGDLFGHGLGWGELLGRKGGAESAQQSAQQGANFRKLAGILNIINHGVPLVNAELIIDTQHPLSVTADNFVCVTMDWWPQEKCDYGWCSWGNTSILSQDLSSPLLRSALKTLSPVLRLGGSLQDHIIYNMSADVPCEPMVQDPREIFRFSGGCLNMDRWDAFYDFAESGGAQIVFGLNGLYGRSRIGNWTYQGDWDPSNARAFLDYNIRAGYKLLGVELGNELGGSTGIAAKLSPYQYARDIRLLRSLVDDLYAANSSSQQACLNKTGNTGPLCVPKPLIIAPDNIDFDAGWYYNFTQELGNSTLTLDGLSHHLYQMGPGVSPSVDQRMLDPVFHDSLDVLYGHARAVKQQAAPGTQLWLGETGGAFNSGRANSSNAFMNGFWYLHELGSAARFNYNVHCRQTLIGGNYGLLQTSSEATAPDLYAAILYKKLMAPTVLNVTVSSNAPDVRVFAHCLRGNAGGVALVVINYSNTTAYQLAHNLAPSATSDALTKVVLTSLVRNEYHFTAGDGGNMHSPNSLLNGVLLQPINGSLPSITGRVVQDSQQVLKVDPLSYVFVALTGVNATNCQVV